MEFDSARYNDYVKVLDVKDIRFPTSLDYSGSDVLHVDPDYSCAYVTLITTNGMEGYGMTFTIGRGTEIVVRAVKSLSLIILGRKLSEIFKNFGLFWRELARDTQLCWLGPEKGVIHLATAAIANSLWDLWARIEEKPLWKLLCDMEPEMLVSTIDMRYITDALTAREAIDILRKLKKHKVSREVKLNERGYPAYCTSVGWLYYSDDKIKELLNSKIQEGFDAFKVKVGQNVEFDKRRLKLIREQIGSNRKLMLDANQIWDVNQAIEWMKQLKEFKPLWIEEPTSPDDILGHATIARELSSLGIAVATGEQCSNRVMFKQMFQAKAFQYCQVDCTRLGGYNEVLAVHLLAAKFKVPVCPHAGGVGLCELMQHTSMWDYICCSGTMDDRMIEYVDHLHEHFQDPIVIQNGRFRVPKEPGASSKLKEESISQYVYPTGTVWKRLFSEKKYPMPKDLVE